MSKFKKRHTMVGARPGTLVMFKDSTLPQVRIMGHTGASLEEWTISDLTDLTDRLQRSTVTWVDVQGLGYEATLRTIGDAFSLHPLALEDVVNVPQRRRIEAYDTHLLLTARMAMLKGAMVLETEQVSFFAGHNCVLTFQERYGHVFDPVRVYLRDTYDQCVQLTDGTATHRERVGGLMHVHLSSIGDRQNELLRVLTIMAALFIPLTFL